MAPLPVIPDTFRVTCNWDAFDGVKPVNVFHVYAPGHTESEVFTTLEANMASEMFTVMPSDFVLPTLTVLQLDGVSAGVIFPFSTPLTGEASGAFLPACAQVISFRTVQRGSQGRGRMFVGPVAEEVVTNGTVDPSPLTNSQSGWTAFVSGLDGGGVADLCVASYKHADQNIVTSGTAERVLGTQRRRQQQLR